MPRRRAIRRRWTRIKPTRALTEGEVALARTIFGDAIDYAAVTVNRRTWWRFQPLETVMAPDGHLWFHSKGGAWRDDFAAATLAMQGLFIHEMTHVWQAQTKGRWWLPLMRHPFCRYRYTIVPGRRFKDYGIEQQAEIVRHAWAARARGGSLRPLDALLPF